MNCGSIRAFDGQTVFLHRNDVLGGKVQIGDHVEFEINTVDDPRGPVAENVSVVPKRRTMMVAPAPKIIGEIMQGTVKFFNIDKRWGFIIPDDGGQNLFVHANDIEGRTLNEGQRVEFQPEIAEKGPRAKKVRVVLGESPFTGLE